MNILIIPSAELSYNSGSVIYAKKLYAYLLKKGHKVKMVGQSNPFNKSPLKDNIIVKKDLLFHPIIDDRPISSLSYSKMLISLLDAINETINEFKNIDVIFVQYASINSYVANIAKDLFNIPYIIASYGRDVNIGYNCDYRIQTFINKSMSQANYILVPTQSVKKRIEEINVNLLDKITIINTPVDNKVITAVNNDIKCDKVIISTINSCFTPEKGIETIILSCYELKHKYNKEFILYIAGTDDDENKKNYNHLKSLINQLKLEDNVIFTGYLSRKDVGLLLKKSFIFIDARLVGNFSSVLLEAQFCNVPTISSKNEAAINIITDGNGLLFEPSNHTELTKKINFLIENPKIRNEIIEKQKKWIKHHGNEYKETSCFKKIEETMQKCIKQKQ